MSLNALTTGSHEKKLIAWGFSYGRHSAAADILDCLSAHEEGIITISGIRSLLLNEVATPDVDDHPKFEEACNMLLDFSDPATNYESRNEGIELWNQFTGVGWITGVERAKAAVTAYEQREDYSIGSVMHIAMEDPNWEEHHIEFCLNLAKAEGDTQAAALCRILLDLENDEQRREALGWPEGYNDV